MSLSREDTVDEGRSRWVGLRDEGRLEGRESRGRRPRSLPVRVEPVLIRFFAYRSPETPGVGPISRRKFGRNRGVLPNLPDVGLRPFETRRYGFIPIRHRNRKFNDPSYRGTISNTATLSMRKVNGTCKNYLRADKLK